MTKPRTIDELRKSLPGRERRVIPAEAGSIEYRAAVGDVGPKIRMFVPFNKRSEDLGGFQEIIAPGAFSRSLKNAKGGKRSDVVALWNHDPAWVLGRQSNQTLTVQETRDGLEGTVTLDAADPMHQHFARRVERRDVQGASFAFRTVQNGDDWSSESDGTILRTLKEVKLDDMSPVTYPAYPASGAEKRSVLDVAAVKLGLDFAELGNILAGAEGGKVARDAAGELRSWIVKLEGMIPEPPVPETDWRTRLMLRDRVVRGA